MNKCEVIQPIYSLQLKFIWLSLMLLQLAKLSASDMKAVKNMKLIEGSDTRKTSSGSFSLKFGSEKVNLPTRRHAYTYEQNQGMRLTNSFSLLEEACIKKGSNRRGRDLGIISVLSHDRGLVSDHMHTFLPSPSNYLE